MTTILLFLIAQPISPYDRDEPAESRRARIETVATAINNVADGNKRLAAMLAIQYVSESALRLDVQECRCPKRQCDEDRKGIKRARGGFQIHKAPAMPHYWESACGASLEAVTAGAEWTRRFYRPKSLECSFAALGGNRVSCGVQWAVDRANAARRLARML